MKAVTEEQKQEKIQQKKEYMRNYMRQWKQKQYAENPEVILRYNRSRYLAKKGDTPEAEKTKYNDFLYSVTKLTDFLKEISSHRPELLPEIFEKANVKYTPII